MGEIINDYGKLRKSRVCEGPKKTFVDVIFGSLRRLFKKRTNAHVGQIFTCLGGN